MKPFLLRGIIVLYASSRQKI
ncbi:hypothetical protein Nmel_000964 [Mimus melanotis]